MIDNNYHSWIDSLLGLDDNTHLTPSQQLLDMVRDIRRAVMVIMYFLLITGAWKAFT